MKILRVLLPLAFAAILLAVFVPSATALPDGEFNIGTCSCWGCLSAGSGARCDAMDCGGPNYRCSDWLTYYCDNDLFAFFPTPSWMVQPALGVPAVEN